MRGTSCSRLATTIFRTCLNMPGEDLPHVHHYYSEPHPYYRKRVVIVGGGNSAAESALEIFRAGGHVTLVHRWPELKSTIKYWVRPDIENRIKEGSIAARFGACVREIRPTAVVLATGEELAGRRGLPARRLSRRLGSPAVGRHRAERSPRADLQPGDVRNERPRAVRRRRRAGRRRHRHDLHRERPVPWREDHRGDCEARLGKLSARSWTSAEREQRTSR